MSDRGPSAAWRRWLPSTVAIFLLAASSFAAIGGLWLRDLRTPRVVLLGAGETHLSTLVTTGDARLLLATGDDPAAFAAALERARHPTTRRLDVVLLAGSGRSLLVPASIRGDHHVRFVAAIAPLPPSPEAEAVVAGGLATLPTPRRIRLADDLTVTVETAFPATSGQDSPLAWRAVIQRGATTVVVLSDGDAATLFGGVGPVSVLVVAGRRPLAAWPAVPASAIVVADGAVSGRELRQTAAEVPHATEWAIRVFPGDAVSLSFVADGLQLPADAAQPLPQAAGPAPALPLRQPPAA